MVINVTKTRVFSNGGLQIFPVKFWCQLLSATGLWRLQGVDSMVARDGVEPPTPAFSGLRSATTNSFIRRMLDRDVRQNHVTFLVA
jgi:hypothetical protein